MKSLLLLALLLAVCAAIVYAAVAKVWPLMGYELRSKLAAGRKGAVTGSGR